MTHLPRITFDQADIDAFYRDIERILLEYGEDPAPHLQKERAQALENAAASLGRCAQQETLPEVDE